MDKEGVVYYSAIEENETSPLATTWLLKESGDLVYVKTRYQLPSIRQTCPSRLHTLASQSETANMLRDNKTSLTKGPLCNQGHKALFPYTHPLGDEI